MGRIWLLAMMVLGAAGAGCDKGSPKKAPGKAGDKATSPAPSAREPLKLAWRAKAGDFAESVTVQGAWSAESIVLVGAAEAPVGEPGGGFDGAHVIRTFSPADGARRWEFRDEVSRRLAHPAHTEGGLSVLAKFTGPASWAGKPFHPGDDEGTARLFLSDKGEPTRAQSASEDSILFWQVGLGSLGYLEHELLLAVNLEDLGDDSGNRTVIRRYSKTGKRLWETDWPEPTSGEPIALTRWKPPRVWLRTEQESLSDNDQFHSVDLETGKQTAIDVEMHSLMIESWAAGDEDLYLVTGSPEEGGSMSFYRANQDGKLEVDAKIIVVDKQLHYSPAGFGVDNHGRLWLAAGWYGRDEKRPAQLIELGPGGGVLTKTELSALASVEGLVAGDGVLLWGPCKGSEPERCMLMYR